MKTKKAIIKILEKKLARPLIVGGKEWDAYVSDLADALTDQWISVETKQPSHEDEFLCRMDNGYIKMCFWTGVKWLDMWDQKVSGTVKYWMSLPESPNN